MTIFILSGADDDHAAHMHRHLLTHGHDAEFLDSRDFPSQMAANFDPQRRTGHFLLPGGRKVKFEDIHSIYWRCYNGVAGVPLPDVEQSHIAANDARSLFESLLIDLPCKWVNGWAGFQMHQTKGAAMRRVAALGVLVPQTLLTNDPAAVREFVERVPGCIFKPVQGGAHTRRVTADHLTDANLASLAIAPVTLQEEIIGTNIRVFVAGQRVLACEVKTDAIDFRDDTEPEIRAIEVPPEIAAQSQRVAGALDLVWTGIDYRRSPDGRYFYLEANPSPMFIGFQRRSGLPLTESLTELLTS